MPMASGVIARRVLHGDLARRVGKNEGRTGGIGGSCTGDLRTSSSRRDVSDEGANSEREGGRPTAPGILGGDALLDLPLLLQSRGSSPFSSNRSASSSSSPTNPGGLPPLLHPRAPGSSPMCPPPPSCRHPFLELHHRDTGNKVQAGKNGPANPAPTNNIEGLK